MIKTPTLLALWLSFASCVWAQEPQKSVRVGRPEIHVSSPLYVADIDCEYHMLVRLQCLVIKSDLGTPDSHAERNWWTPDELRPFVLESEDMKESGLQRGHVRALRWSRGSCYWPDCNMTGVIVPQYPKVNNGPIKSLEDHVVALVEKHERVLINFECRFGPHPVATTLPDADESCRIPERFYYELLPVGKQMTREIYEIPNRPEVQHDYRIYRVDPLK